MVDRVHTLPDRLGVHIVVGESSSAILRVDPELPLSFGDIGILSV